MMIRLLAFAAALALATPAVADDIPPRVMVNGTGEVSVAPDMATITIGVETQAETASAALARNNRAAEEVIQTLKENGVAAEDIQTANFSVYPVYEDMQPQTRPRPEGPRIIGYRVANQVVAEVHDLDRLGTLLDAAVSGGANRIDGLSFGLEDDAEVADRARALAVEDARRRAEVMADAAGVRLGDVLSITETGGGPPVPYYDMAARAEVAMSVPIERGQTTVTANVQIVWELVPGPERP